MDVTCRVGRVGDAFRVVRHRLTTPTPVVDLSRRAPRQNINKQQYILTFCKRLKRSDWYFLNVLERF